MDYYYTFTKADEYITVSGNGEVPTDCQDIVWTSSPGAQGVLEQLDGIEDVYAPTIGFVSVNDYPNDIYVQIAKFSSIYKNGWRFGETNLPTIEPDVTKSEVLEKGKTKKRVYVKGTGKRASYWRMQEVGREEIDPKKIENLWDISLDQFQRLVSGDKELLKERYINEHKYKSYDTHPKLEYLRGLMSERIQHNTNPSLSYFDESIMDIGGISRHEQAVGMALSADEIVPLHVLKDYPELAELYGINISDSALILTTPVTKYTKLYEMPKDEYDRILDEVKVDCDTDPDHVTDAILNQDYSEELADVKRSAKLRKRLFNKLPEHMRYGYTPDTMDGKLHRELVEMAHRYNIEIPAETKAGYPTLYTDMPFKYEITGNEECDAAANDILTQIRAQLETEGCDPTKLAQTIHEIIGATDESVPIMYGAGVEPGLGEEIADSVVNVISSTLIGPDLKDRIKNFKKSTGRARVMIAYDDGIRSYQSGGVITLGTYYSKTVAHEYGHAIDWMLPEINELSQAFLNRRTEDEPLVSLAEIIPQGGYADDELAKPDNFMEAYIGKRYDHSSSEVLSMGMGYLSSSGGMMAMYEQDPEYLGYIVAVLSGRAHGAEVTHGPMRGSDEPGAYEPTNKSETIEINLYKLLNTTGLTRKRVLVRKPGQTPFWSTRWVQQGDTVKDTVEAAGFELVAEEGEEPEPVSLKDLITSAYDAGKAAYEEGLPNRSGSDPKLKEITKQNPGSVKDEIAIHVGWVNGWTAANIAAPVPGVLDDPKPEDKGEISFELIKPAYEAGKATFRAGGSDVPGTNPGLAAIIREGNHTQATLEQLSISWKKGWDEESKKAPEPEPKTVKPSVGKVADIISNTERDFTIDVTPETQKQLDHFNLKNGVNFSGVSKKNMLSISDGLEKSVGKYGIKLGYIGWHQGKKRHPVPGKYIMYPAISEYQSITLHKTMTKNMVKLNEKDKSNFAYAKVTNIAGTKAKLEESVFESTINNYKRKLIKYENCNRWLVSNDAPDPLSSAVAHEGYHAVYFGNKLEEKWNTNLEVMPGYIGIDDPRCCTVSEYGVSSESELFAEVGAALAYDIDIDPEVKMAFERTVEGLL